MSSRSGPSAPPTYIPAEAQHLGVDGAVLRYRDEGRGPAVLLIHGWTMDCDLWAPQVAGLSDAFRLIRFDRRGFGLSSGEPSLAADASDALALCDHLGVKHFACVGMSQGARIALQLCRSAANRLTCVVLDGPPELLPCNTGHSTGDIPLAEYQALLARGDLETFRRQWASHPLMQLCTGDPAARELLQRMVLRYNARDLRQAAPSATTPEWNRAALSTLHLPALVLSGKHDLPSRLRAATELAAALPGAQRAVIEAARHIPGLDNPQRYNEVLREFFEQHASASPTENTDV